MCIRDRASFPESLKEEIFIKHLSGPLFFGYTNEFQELSQQIPDTASHVILRMDKVPYMDQSGVYAVEDTVLALQLRGISVYIVGVQKQPLFMMERIDIIPDLVPKECIFKTFDECMNYLQTFVKNKN